MRSGRGSCLQLAQKIEHRAKRPGWAAVWIPRQRPAKCFGWASVLKQQAGCYRCVLSIDGCCRSGLRCIQENLGNIAALKPSDADNVMNSGVVDLEELMQPPVGKPCPHCALLRGKRQSPKASTRP